jgi:hypothetical protein
MVGAVCNRPVLGVEGGAENTLVQHMPGEQIVERGLPRGRDRLREVGEPERFA